MRLARWPIALYVLAGCGNSGSSDYARAAQEELTKAFSCPKERVVVTPRPDLKPFDLLVGRHEVPPADVAADPSRLRVWKEQRQKIEDDYNQDRVFEARGCDQRMFYVCGMAEGSNQSQVIACRKAEHPPAK